MRTNLKARLKKLETTLCANEGAYPVVVFGERNRPENEIIGIGTNGQSAERKPGETVVSLIARGGRELRQTILFLAYTMGKHGDTFCFLHNDRTEDEAPWLGKE